MVFAGTIYGTAGPPGDGRVAGMKKCAWTAGAGLRREAGFVA
jgi:hypothetical protein